jgi:hypothetical protein
LDVLVADFSPEVGDHVGHTWDGPLGVDYKDEFWYLRQNGDKETEPVFCGGAVGEAAGADGPGSGGGVGVVDDLFDQGADDVRWCDFWVGVAGQIPGDRKAHCLEELDEVDDKISRLLDA